MQKKNLKGFEHSLWHSFLVPLLLMQHGLVSPNFQETKEIKYCSVKTKVPLGSRWGGFGALYLLLVLFFSPFSILHLLFKKLSLRGEKANKSWLLLSSGDLAVVWRSWCSVSVSLHSPELYPVMYLFIITDGQIFFSPFQFVLSKAAGFWQRSTAFPQWWSSSSKAELDVKSFWSGEEEEGGESHCAKNLSCVVSCEIMYRRRFVMVQVSNCCFRAMVSAKLMMYLIFSESSSFPLLPFKQTVFQVGKQLKCSIYWNMYR